jgi:hypothetical protein
MASLGIAGEWSQNSGDSTVPVITAIIFLSLTSLFTCLTIYLFTYHQTLAADSCYGFLL